jgi:hypothetical protein
MARKPIVRRALGLMHTRWLLRPKRAAIAAGLWYLMVLVVAAGLGIVWKFKVNGKTVVGFADSHWGPLFLFAMPLAGWLIGYYLRLLENALQGIDEVVVPASEITARPFSEFISGRLRYAWMSWIFPLAVAAPVVLTIIADGRDIIAPLQSRAIPPSNEVDWSTLGYATRPQSAIWYLVFNLLAWSMQVFLGYCALIAIFSTTFILGIVFRYGLGGRRVADLLLPPSVDPLPEKYKPQWNCKKLRCGLEDLDLVFGFFVAFVILVLLTCAVSILDNAYLKDGADLGSAILAFGSVLLLPAAVLWIFQPYFSSFPRGLPDEFKGKPDYVEPSPWPFGSEKVAWGIIVAAWLLWGFLVCGLARI